MATKSKEMKILSCPKQVIRGVKISTSANGSPHIVTNTGDILKKFETLLWYKTEMGFSHITVFVKNKIKWKYHEKNQNNK